MVTAVIHNIHSLLELNGDSHLRQLVLLSNSDLVHHPSVPGWRGVGEEGLVKDQVKGDENWEESVV